MIALVASLLLSAAAAPATAPATPEAFSFPGFDGASESLIVGPGKKAGPVEHLGEWEWSERGVALKAPDPARDALWFPSSPNATLGDGAVRWRMRFGSKVDLTFLFRARLAGPELERFSGYGLSIEGNKILFYRWDNGLPRPLHEGVRVAKLTSRPGIEVVLFAVGPLLSATVYDVDTLELLTTVAVTDRRYAEGVVGLRAAKSQDPETRVILMSTLRAATGRRDDPGAFAGSARLVTLAPEDMGRLPADLQTTLAVPDPGPPAHVTLALDVVALERARRAGVEPLTLGDRVPWRYIDPDYASRRGQPPRATDTGFAVDLAYKDARQVGDLLAAYAARFPTLTRLERVGESVQGRPIWALRIAGGSRPEERRPAVLLNGAHHGLELVSSEQVLDAVQWLLERYDTDAGVRRWVDALAIWCVPLVNPDGRDAFMEQAMAGGRKNARDVDGDGRVSPDDGVDLNRNYPFRWGALGEVGSRSWPEHYRYRGPAAGSEPETRAVMALARRERFVASISYHTNGTVVLSPYTVDGVQNPVNDEAWPVAESVAAAAPTQPNGKKYRVQRNIYPVDGVDQDWMRAELGTVALLVEGPLHNPREPELRHRVVDAGRPTWMALLDRYVNGPSLEGNVKNADGEALEAEVRITEIAPRAGERWTSRPRDGFFARFVPRPGTYTLEIVAPGYERYRRRLDVPSHVDGIAVVLEPSPSPSVSE